jgi:hypothetical protein
LASPFGIGCFGIILPLPFTVVHYDYVLIADLGGRYETAERLGYSLLYDPSKISSVVSLVVPFG